MAHLLVTGGAGYVGSHVTRALASAGHDVVVLDDLSMGWAAAVAGRLVKADVRDAKAVGELLSEGFDAVVHMAAKMSVAESVTDPGLYWSVNVGGTLTLLDAMAAHGCTKVVFSSTAAVFGESSTQPIPSHAPMCPTSPYGETKATVERLLSDLDAAGKLRFVALRYFNAVGASEDGWIGEAHDPETHLIPLALRALKQGTAIRLFGTEHPTRDGTALRDYVHVLDLADAHVRAVEHLLRDGDSARLNLGTGVGATVREVLGAAENATGRSFSKIESRNARTGDPPALVADPHDAQQQLAWQPTRTLETALADAWRWHSKPRFGPGTR